ncbi:cytochrome P450 family protein [Streptomyces pseudovenezuelae]|uniref:P450-derived glycosyltransferase activator n=1 Tax=Streptomyces pseudovenezuelae TaxID=67350 RepID=A0ABT6LB00_9ACTN|nr:P450-derived glycosyltransferase activator [Streptomyces pseudovenezuelae]MDH6213160.1 P450-derived glycosyltransferase activator [Streptomyces pseudovenezuelae]
MTDAALGRVLLTLRGVQWILGTKGDPYALLLRAAGDDPAELGRRVRRRGPLYWSSAGAWVTADHEVAAAALADGRMTPRPPSARTPHVELAEEPAPWDVPALYEALPLTGLPAALDREEYERLRHWADPFLGEQALRPWHAAAVRNYRSRASALGERFDLVDDLIRPATVEAARVLLGLPDHRAARFAELSAAVAGVLDATLCPPRLDTARRYRTALPELHTLLAQTVEEAASGGFAGGRGLISRLLRTPGRDRSPVATDVVTVCALLTFVGIEAATTLTGNAVALLLDHPDQWRALCEDPELASDAVAETLRHAPPVRLHRLYARRDLELAGTPVAAGEELVVLIGAAHRDPGRHPDPDRFDIHRPAHDRHPLPEDGHAGGLVGSATRLATDAALRALAANLPGLVRTDEVLRRLRSPITGSVFRFPAARHGTVREQFPPGPRTL